MHPTIQDQLAGAMRLLDSAMADPGTPVPVSELLTNARRLLRQAERSWATLPAFHAADNARLVALLTDLRADLPTDPATPLGPLELGERNAHLRGLLSDAVAELSRTGQTERLQHIHRYLHDRALSDPSS